MVLSFTPNISAIIFTSCVFSYVFINIFLPGLTLGYTEHIFAHVTAVAEKAGYILKTLGYDARMVELAKIAGYLHDIGNLVNRDDHSQSGAVMAFLILDHLKFPPEEIGMIVSVIGGP